MFSIIIPLYNKAGYIEKALYSVLNQIYREFEVIIVNDGSTDDSLKNLQFVIRTIQAGELNFSDKIKVIDQKNQGVSTARNNGVKAARYNYIAFLDADDWWEATYLEEMKKLIDEFPSAGIYGSSYYKVKNGQNICAKTGVDSGFERGLIDYFRAYSKSLWMPLWTCSTIIKKEVFESENGFKPKLKLGEDFDLWMRVALKFPVALINKPLAFYNQDVEINNRALGKLYPPEEHILWNLNFLKEEEKKNTYLKQLLDNLRTYGLLEYYLSKNYRSVAKQELNKVNWSNQPKKMVAKYKRPIFLLKLSADFMSVGSKVKKIVQLIIH